MTCNNMQQHVGLTCHIIFEAFNSLHPYEHLLMTFWGLNSS